MYIQRCLLKEMRSSMKWTVGIAIALTALTLSFLCAGCTNDPVGGPCPYSDFPGTATIRTGTPGNSSGSDCENGVIIVFDFAPTDSSDVDDYRFPAWPDTGRVFELSSGGSVPDRWADKEGLTPGSKHQCIRREIRVGPCTPLLFKFPDVDYSDVRDYCDEPSQ
jgi:hypothetical protein